MKNLSEEVKKATNCPLTKSNFDIDPHTLIAENISDFQKEAPKLFTIGHKKYPWSDDILEIAYIFFENIHIRREKEREHSFILYDNTSFQRVSWDMNHPVFTPTQSYQEAIQQEGLRDMDQVYTLKIGYDIQKQESNILFVQKYKLAGQTETDDDSLLGKIKAFMPEWAPVVQPRISWR